MRSLWWHCWTLCALAVTPVIDIIRRDPAFLLANDFGPWQLALLLVVLLVLAPLPLVLAAWRLGKSANRWAALALAPPALAIGLYLGGRLGLELTRLLPAVALAGLLCWSYSRSPALRQWLGWLSLVALVAPIQLLLDPGVHRVVARADGGQATLEDSIERPPIAVLLLDELPTTTLLDNSGSIDRRRFPNLAALADTAYWFENFWSVDPATERAVPALLSGTVPPPGALPVARDLPLNLFTLLAPHYRIAASETVSKLCPRDLNSLARQRQVIGDNSWLIDVGVLALHLWTPQPLAGSVLPPIERDWQRFPNRPLESSDRPPLWERLPGPKKPRPRSDRVSRFRQSLGGLDESTTSGLYFAHLMLPHRPWIYFPQGEGYLADGLREMKDFGRERWPNHAAVANRAHQRHLLQAEFTDRLVGEFLDRLRATGRFDASTIIVTADHGISFRPGDRVRQLSASNVEDLLRVPLLLKLPGQRFGETLSEAKSALDLLPTLLEVADITAPVSLPGESLFAPGVTAKNAVELGGALDHRTSVFESLEKPGDLFSFGPFSEWIGTATHLALPPHPEAKLSLLGEGSRFRRDEGAAPLPAWIYGWVDSRDDLSGFGLAVAVDGTVVATGECQRIEGHNRLNVLLPPSALAPGDHQIDVVLIAPDSSEAWLLPETG